MANTYKMTERDIQQLILLRASNSAIFTGRKNSAMRGWRAIKRELGLHGLMSARQLKKKWDNLNQKYKVIKNPPEGEKPKNPASWPWYYLMDDAVSGRLGNSAKVLEPLAIDDEQQEQDLPLRTPSDSEELLNALNVEEMAPIESEEDVEMIDKSGNYEEPKRLGETARRGPKVAAKTLESVPASPESARAKAQQNAVLYATLLPDSTASVASKAPASVAVRAQPVDNTSSQTVPQARVLYATLLPDSTATTSGSNGLALNGSVALELAELNRKLLEFKRERFALEREQAEFDKELIRVGEEREQLSEDRRTLDSVRAENERDRAALDRSRAELEREKAEVERDRVFLDRDRAYLERDRAVLERDKIFLEKAREDLESQRETFKKEANAAEDEQMDVSQKYNDLTEKVLHILTSESDRQETRQRFAMLLEKLSEKL